MDLHDFKTPMRFSYYSLFISLAYNRIYSCSISHWPSDQVSASALPVKTSHAALRRFRRLK